MRERERAGPERLYGSVSPSLIQVELTSSCFARVLNHLVPGDTSRRFRTLLRDNASILMRARCTCRTSLLLSHVRMDKLNGFLRRLARAFTPIGPPCPVPNAVPGATNASELIWSSLRGYVHNPHSPLRHGRPQSRYEAVQCWVDMPALPRESCTIKQYIICSLNPGIEIASCSNPFGSSCGREPQHEEAGRARPKGDGGSPVKEFSVACE